MGNPNNFLIAYSTEITDMSKSLSGDHRILDIVNNAAVKIEKVNGELVRKNIIATINNLVDAFEGNDIRASSYYVDEIEVSLDIGLDGTVSIVSLSGGAKLYQV